jgi:hypothetical protein
MLRILHDSPARTSTRTYLITPETERLDGTNTQTVLDTAWQKYAIDLNALDYVTLYGSHKASPKAVRLIQNNVGGICNGGWPKLMHIGMGGNAVQATAIDVVHQTAILKTLRYQDGPPSILDVNYFTHPELVFKWVNVGWDRTLKKTYWQNPYALIGGFYDAYWPNVSDITVHMPLVKLEAFPTIPDSGLPVTIKVPLHARVSPYGQIIGDLLSPGQTVRVVTYATIGSDVWGYVIGGGCIPLEGSSPTAGPTYFTSWRMKTIPPPFAPLKVYSA